MVRKRPDSFTIALETIRKELRAGIHAPSTRLTASDIAVRLGLSPTPVREALSRLVGEGLLHERRGQGAFVPRLQEHDVVALFRLQMELLLVACEGAFSSISHMAAEPLAEVLSPPSSAESRSMAGERLMRTLAALASPALARELMRLQDQLAPIRALEDRLVEAPANEVAQLSRAISQRDPDQVRSQLRAFFSRRIAAAPQLTRLRNTQKNIESI